jgi:hypothetical protein
LSQGSLSDVVRDSSFLRSGVNFVFGRALGVLEALFSESTIVLDKWLLGLS